MLAENYETIESIMLTLGLIGLFSLMAYAVHDVLKSNDVPLIGRIVAYGVLGLGALGFLVKGIIELVYLSAGV